MATVKYSTSELFINFMSAYKAKNSVTDDDTAISNLCDDLLSSDSTKKIDFSDPTGNIKVYASDFATVNSDVDFSDACKAIADGQHRLINIIANPNFSDLASQIGDTKAQYVVLFSLMFYDGVSSSFDVTSFVPDEFVYLFVARFDDLTAKVADSFYNSAANIRSFVMLAYMSVKTSSSSNKGRIEIWNNYNDKVSSNYDGLPNFEQLFGQENYIQVDEFESVLSPAAYLVDLEKCRQQYVTDDGQKLSDDMLTISIRASTTIYNEDYILARNSDGFKSATETEKANSISTKKTLFQNQSSFYITEDTACVGVDFSKLSGMNPSTEAVGCSFGFFFYIENWDSNKDFTQLFRSEVAHVFSGYLKKTGTGAQIRITVGDGAGGSPNTNVMMLDIDDPSVVQTGQWLFLGVSIQSGKDANGNYTAGNCSLVLGKPAQNNVDNVKIIAQAVGTSEGKAVPASRLFFGTGPTQNEDTRLYLQNIIVTTTEVFSINEVASFMDNSNKFTFRRPDIFTLPLTEANTTTEVPKLTIVNNLLCTQLAKQMDVDQDTLPEHLSEKMKYPFNVPYSYNFAQLTASLDLLGTDLASVFNSINKPVDGSKAPPVWAALNVSPVMSDLIGSAITSSSDLASVYERYGLDNLMDSSSSINDLTLSLFQKSTELDGDDVADIVYDALSDSELEGNQNPQSTFYINDGLSSVLSITQSEVGDYAFEGQSIVGMDRLNRALRVQAISGLNFIELNWLLINTAKNSTNDDALTEDTTYIYVTAVQQIMDDYSISTVNQAVAVVGLLKDFGRQSGSTFIQSVFGSVAPNYGDSTGPWDASSTGDDDDQAIGAALMSGLGLSQTDLQTLVSYVVTANSLKQSKITLDQQFLSALYRVASSASLFKLSIESMLYLLDSLYPDDDVTCKQLAMYITENNTVVGCAAIFKRIESFVSRLSDADISLDSVMFMNASEYQDKILFPGDIDRQNLVNQINSGLTDKLLLSKENFVSAMLTLIQRKLMSGSDVQYTQQELGINLGTIYGELITDGNINGYVNETGKTTGFGVVIDVNIKNLNLTASGFAKEDWDLITGSVSSTLLRFQENQQANVNSVMQNALSLTSDVAQTVSDWGAFLFSSSAGAGANALHVFYTQSDSDTQLNYYKALKRFATLINDVGLSAQEVSFILDSHSDSSSPFYNTDLTPPDKNSDFSVSLQALMQILELHELNVSYADADNSLLNFLQPYSKVNKNVQSLNDLILATGWSESDLHSALKYWSYTLSGLSGSYTVNIDKKPIAVVKGLLALIELRLTTGLSIDTLTGFSSLDSNAADFSTIADNATQAIYALNPLANADSIAASLTIPTAESYRDVLVEAVLYKYRYSDSTVLNAIEDVNSLSEYLLTDVEVSGKFYTSRVKEAIGAYQTYFYRIIMKLEPGLEMDAEFVKNLWDWFKSYRVWEANRKVFVTPENYLEPDLRKNSSDIFNTFQSSLKQGTVNESTISTAFQNYLTDFSTIANLKVVASHLGDIDYETNQASLFFVGYSKTTQEYYYRIATLSYNPNTYAYTPADWQPWVKVNIKIPADQVKITYAFDRLFLFWIEYTLADSAGDNSGDGTYTSYIKYTYFQASSDWSQPQSVEDMGFDADYSTAESGKKTYSNYVKYREINDVLTLSLTTDSTGKPIVSIYYSYIDYKSASNGKGEVQNYTYNLLANMSAEMAGNSSGSEVSATSSSLPIYFNGVNEDSSMIEAFDGSNTSAISTLHNNKIIANNSNGSNASYLISSNDKKCIQVKLNSDFPISPGTGNNGTLGTITMGGWFYIESNDDTDILLSFANGAEIASVALGLRVTSSNHGALAIELVADSDEVLIIKPEIPLSINSQKGNWYFICGSFKQTNGADWQYSYYLGAIGDEYNTQSSLKTVGYKSGFVKQGYSWYAARTLYVGYGAIDGKSKIGVPVNSGLIMYVQNFFVHNVFVSSEKDFAAYSGLTMDIADNLPFDNDKSLSVKTIDNAFVNSFFIMTDTDGTEYLAMPASLDTYRFVRLSSSNVAPAVESSFFTGGLDSLLSIDSQLTSEGSFEALGPDPTRVPEKYWPADGHIDIGGANSLYYSELFMHAPWLVAQTYAGAGNYQSAEKWYQYIFDPTKTVSSVSDSELALLQQDNNVNDIYWRFIGLRTAFSALLSEELFAASNAGVVDDDVDVPIESDMSSSGNTFALSPTINQAMQAYYDDPFDPHAIATLRPKAYQEAVVMHYVQTLLDWGDSYYMEETRESILEAVTLYMTANDLLGVQPQAEGEFVPPDQSELTLQAIVEKYIIKDNSTIPEFLVGLEGSLDNINNIPATVATTTQLPYNFEPGLYFGIPQNEQLLSFWQIVDSRLYNIRNNLDINGNEMDLALFQPEINPMSLVSAAAKGSLQSELNHSEVMKIPNYRFLVQLGRAKDFSVQVSQFGQLLLSVYERKDAEALAQLQLNQQATVLTMSLAMKQYQIDAARDNLDALTDACAAALLSKVFYQGLLEWERKIVGGSAGVVDALEKTSNFPGSKQSTVTDADTDVSVNFDFTNTARGHMNEILASQADVSTVIYQTVAAAIHYLTIPACLIPNVFGLANGGQRFGKAVDSTAQALSATAFAFNFSSGALKTRSSYQRRTDEWQFQLQQAEHQLAQSKARWSAANYQLSSAQQDYTITEKQISQNAEILTFYQSKFTNEDLYQWMKGLVNNNYYQAYKLAVSVALDAQTALEYEKGLPMGSLSIVNTTSWNSNYSGLMAADPLIHSMNELEKYYMDIDNRRLEITKTISLKSLFEKSGISGDFASYVSTTMQDGGGLQIHLNEKMFDQDYPGHYLRQIKMVSLSIPAVLGPYQDLHAVLTQTSNTVVIDPDISTIDGLLNNTDDGSDDTKIRNIAPPCAAVTISRGIDDSGMFAPEMADSRYLPFEGSGAVSSWNLYISDLDENLHPTVDGESTVADLAISDIILTIRYTAMNGGRTFANSVITSLGSSTSATGYIGPNKPSTTDTSEAAAAKAAAAKAAAAKVAAAKAASAVKKAASAEADYLAKNAALVVALKNKTVTGKIKAAVLAETARTAKTIFTAKAAAVVKATAAADAADAAATKASTAADSAVKAATAAEAKATAAAKAATAAEVKATAAAEAATTT
ncbi:MAG: hypothetical protein GY784_02530 [Gammaproteobacteria bacterium]|nr:hypothetical protein [Gammaproteobacteria bacterium]